MDKNIEAKKGSKARKFEGTSMRTLPKSKKKITTLSN
jgi:hypothetical protein